ncbi:LysR family transcriptional regulator [Caldalkalibacillus mannanilyticus]|uniref:LysR family transcriptional regulator n=1 Tax=Caldalkalibacillus mannanilyticus TaxID=1418 RepID=UPI0004685F57|nr:LysR family transcriptional regulator [Caldalkalibacillus mannanilyticus]
MELRQIKYFIEVAKGEHLTQAADKLHIAQSAISRQIANLEKELNVQLFIRKGRNVILTPIGQIFLQRVEAAILEIDGAIQEVSEYIDPEIGEIRIGFPHSLAAFTLPNVVAAFRKEHPNVRFQLSQGKVNELIDDLIKGEIDIALVSPVPIDHPEVEGHILFTEEIMAILPPDHPLAHKESILLNELENELFVMFRTGFTLRNIVIDACDKAGFIPEIAFEGEETDTIRGLVAAGLGVGLLPNVALKVQGPLETANVRISDPIVTRTVGFVTSRHRKLTPSERIFQQFLWNFYQKE